MERKKKRFSRMGYGDLLIMLENPELFPELKQPVSVWNCRRCGRAASKLKHRTVLELPAILLYSLPRSGRRSGSCPGCSAFACITPINLDGTVEGLIDHSRAAIAAIRHGRLVGAAWWLCSRRTFPKMSELGKVLCITNSYTCPAIPSHIPR